jgi:dTDP-4-dehydrorhamnose 3,5-epimerase
MEIVPTDLAGVLVLEPTIIRDDRGFLFESWNRRDFEAATGVEAEFVQDNQSGSKQRVLRGLHYQVPPEPQGKLVRAVVGSVFDVAVDLRATSPTFGRWFGTELSAENHRQLWIPVGFAHGFLTTSDWAEVHYKVNGYYSRRHERVLRWDDPDVGIAWPIDLPPLLSDRDRSAPGLHQIDVFT